MKEKPPSSIILDDQYRFIDSGIDPNSNLTANTNKLRKIDKYFQIKPLHIAQIKAVCDWYEVVEMNNSSDNSETQPKLEDKVTIKHPLNQILFGPAGTGKTYHTINHAVAIIDGLTEEVKRKSRKDLKDRFDYLVGANQIRFVTFHQSFSYEDFVEGIRAETTEKNEISYIVKPGVFKQICDDARNSEAEERNVITDEAIEEALINFIEDAKKHPIEIKSVRTSFQVKSSQSGILTYETSSEKEYGACPEHIKTYLKTGSDTLINNTTYDLATAKHLRVNYLRAKIDSGKNNSDPKPYVLIIDEINRGNISRIFGELITLIEDSKREGASESLSVTLPYSGKEFSVPNNVYIIGTMNSSDRSLTGLDLALRRRFTFVEMQPDTNLLEGKEVDGLKVGELLEVMNQRIEVLLDRDHCIGHAYFMPLTGPVEATVENLKMIFLQQIIPLLQEYFFDDWSKINLVLNSNEMLQPEKIDKNLFTANEARYLQDKKIWRLNNDAFDNIETYKKILIQGTDRVTSDDSQHAPE